MKGNTDRLKKIGKNISGFWGKVFSIFRWDMKKIFTNPIAAIIAAGLMILPSFYAWFNIEASWDPYGNTGNLTVAVANCDDGYSLKGIQVNMGNSIVDSLAGNDSIGWRFMSKDDAVSGVESGEYYAALVIPDDFSKDMMSVLTPEMTRPSLEYYVNEKKNAIAPKITNTAMSTVQQQVNAAFVDQGMTMLCDTIIELYNKYADSDLSDISPIDAEKSLENTISILNQVSDHLNETQTLLGVFQDTGKTVDSLLTMVQKTLDRSAESLSKTEDTVNAVTGSADSLGASLTNVIDSLDALMDSTDESIGLIDGLLEDISSDIVSGADGAADAVENVNRAVERCITPVKRMKDICNSLADQLQQNLDGGMIEESHKVTITDPENPDQTITLSLYDSYTKAIQSLRSAASRLSETEDQLELVSSELEEMISDLREGSRVTAADLDRIQKDAGKAAELMTNAVKEFDRTAKEEIKNCSSYLADSADRLIDASGDLSAILPYLDITISGGRESLDSAGNVIDGTAALIGSFNTTLKETIGNLKELKEDVHDIQSSVNVKTVLEDALGIDFDNYTDNTAEFAQFISSPVNLDTKTLYHIENYGSSMTPFYSILAIWVGCTLLLALLKTEVRESEGIRLSRYRHYHLYLGRYCIFMLFAVIQAVIICLGDLYILGIQCEAPVRFILVGVLAAITFSNIGYTLTICLGDVGKAIYIILLIIQVAGAGGTFPVELTPSFFNDLNPFMPFTHGINAMRECIGGFYGHNYLFSLIKMCVYFPIFLIFGTVFRKPLIRMMKFFHRKLDETGIM